MNNANKYGNNAYLEGPRSLFPVQFKRKTTLNTGKLIPICKPLLVNPADTWDLSISFVLRGNTPIADVMDDSQISFWAFFVPMRTVWQHWQQFQGENDSSAWTQTDEYTIPTLPSISTFVQPQSLAHYMDLPYNLPISAGSISCLPFRGYYKIWNEYFRDQNYQSPVLFGLGEEFTLSGRNPGSSSMVPPSVVYEDLGAISGVMPVNRFHDYFTSVLPSPQKGEAVTFPLGSGLAELTAIDGAPYNLGGSIEFGDENSAGVQKFKVDDAPQLGLHLGPVFESGAFNIDKTNIYANLDDLQAITISEFRNAVVAQHVYEALARNGSRYAEILDGIWGVKGDISSRLDRAEALGRLNSNVTTQQVNNTTNGDGVNGLGQVGSFSLTSNSSHLFTKSMKEHGLLYILAAVRTNQSYTQGVHRDYTRLDYWDFYQPLLEGLSEQPVYEREIYATSANVKPEDKTVFGYNERWAEYKHFEDRVTGYLDPNVPQSVPYWTFANKFSSAPTAVGLLPETVDNVDRTVRVTSAAAHFQWILDVMVSGNVARRMKTYSIPGIDRI